MVGRNIANQESKNLEVQKTKQNKIVASLKVSGYILMWLFIWSFIAITLAVGSVFAIAGIISKEDDGIVYLTAQQANNMVLTVVLIIAAIFFCLVWLLRKKTSLSYRVSRRVLFICTVIGLLISVPLSLLGVWVSDDMQQNQVEQVDVSKDIERYQYMLCSNGSYMHYTNEQMEDSRVGFTEDSEDDCKRNKQGIMMKLTNDREEIKANDQKSTVIQQPTSYPVEQSYRSEPMCFNYTIYYDYDRIASNEYTVGRGKTIQNGANGEGVRCYENGNIVSDKIVKKPVNNIYVYGTRENSYTDSDTRSNSHSCGYYASLGLSNSTFAAGCTP